MMPNPEVVVDHPRLVVQEPELEAAEQAELQVTELRTLVLLTGGRVGQPDALQPRQVPVDRDHTGQLGEPGRRHVPGLRVTRVDSDGGPGSPDRSPTPRSRSRPGYPRSPTAHPSSCSSPQTARPLAAPSGDLHLQPRSQRLNGVFWACDTDDAAHGRAPLSVRASPSRSAAGTARCRPRNRRGSCSPRRRLRSCRSRDQGARSHRRTSPGETP